MPRRSYDQYCAIARALDVLGERWTLLIVRELLGGPRRYSDLLADLPGISTDVLAARLREMEGDALITRRPIATRGNSWAYDLTLDGRELAPVVESLAGWGSGRLDGRGATDAVRGHWFALPLARRFRDAARSTDHRDPADTIEVRLEEGAFHVTLSGDAPAAYADGPAERPDAVVATDHATAAELAAGRMSLPEAVRGGHAVVSGRTPLAAALSGGAGETAADDAAGDAGARTA
jgi:DNA-binding HxlR family transcriptional regulator